MKKRSPKLGTCITVFAMAASLVVGAGCDRDGEELDVDITDPGDVTELDVLTAINTSAAPAIDGIVEAAWGSAEAIYVPVDTPDIASFPGYAGRGYQVKLRAMHDSQNVYFLAEWDDPALNMDRQTWYFDTDLGAWKQESGRHILDEDGNITRTAFYEDKFSMMFEATPVDGFDTQGCWVACHTGISPSSNDAGKRDLKYTNNGGEVMDMWHWKSVRGTSQGALDDQYTDWQRTAPSGGRHSDPGVNAYVNNVATVDGLKVPKFVIPNASARYFWVETDGSDPTAQDAGLALLVTGASADGKLTLSDGTVIDPVTDLAFQRDGAQGPPSIYTRPVSGDRADIDAVGVYSGGWTLEFKRPLTTASDGKDIQFDDLDVAYPFGVAVFDNAQIAHAVSNLPVMLKFER